MSFDALHLRKSSLLRGTVLVLGSLVMAIEFSHFPQDEATLKMWIPTVLACLGLADTFRCLRRRWSLYHGAVLIFLYSDLLAVLMILFLLLYPYARWMP